MIIRTTSISGRDLPTRYRTFELEETMYSPASVGEAYPVLGLMMLRNRVDVLISPQELRPMLFPLPLAELVDAHLPPFWMICDIKSSDGYRALQKTFGIYALVGYEALVADYRHYAGILEREPKELERFRVAEIQMRQWLED